MDTFYCNNGELAFNNIKCFINVVGQHVVQSSILIGVPIQGSRW